MKSLIDPAHRAFFLRGRNPSERCLGVLHDDGGGRHDVVGQIVALHPLVPEVFIA